MRRTQFLVLLVLALAKIILAQEDVEYQAPTPEGDYFFLENFNEDVAGRWNIINNEKYQGVWKWTTPSVQPGIEGDYGLMITEPARHYAAVAPFSKPLVNEGKDLVIQYEVKTQDRLQCGGAYMKLFSIAPGVRYNAITNETPYVIMFGPDKCGDTNKVHFIFRHQNPISKIWEEKHATDVPRVPSDTKTHLYTLVIRPNNTFDMFVDMELKKSGSFFEDFAPAVNPPKEIDDPSDEKPADWVDEAKIPDPEATKPEDWDETAPAMIPDPEDEKPAEWLEDEPETIPDPEARMPEEWDEEEDGQWMAPQVPNPVCEEVGCGEWKPRMIPNPEYKGKWSAPLIDNPAYKGEWKPRQIPNPDYFVDETPYKMPEMGALGVEIWTMQGKILFDNFLITRDLAVAMNYAEKTFKVKSEEEAKKEPEPEEDKNNVWEQYLRQVSDLIEAAVAQYGAPTVIGVVAGSVILPIIIMLLMCRGGEPAKKQKVKKEEAEVEKKTEVVKGQAEDVKKRQPRNEE